jgi:3-dehydroquinate dehydratase-2
MAQPLTLHIVNGPNLNLTGTREPAIYGSRTFESYLAELQSLFPQNLLRYFQSNHEGALIDYLQSIPAAEGVILNAGALSHYSLALADAVKACPAPVVEVHISNIYAREAFRAHSVLSPLVVATLSGFGLAGYRLAVQFLNQHLQPAG